jgi:hypothetical protein
MRKLLNRKIVEQDRIGAIGHEKFTDYNDIVPDFRATETEIVDVIGYVTGSLRQFNQRSVQAFIDQKFLSCLNWKWRERSFVKITERTYEKRTSTPHR